MRFRIRSKPPLAPRDFYRCSWHQVKAAKPGDQGEIEVFVRCIVRNIDENSVASRTSLSRVDRVHQPGEHADARLAYTEHFGDRLGGKQACIV